MKSKKSKIEIDQVKPILDALYEVNGTTLEQLTGHKRKYIFDRMIFSGICNQNYTLSAIAEFMNMKSHSSILFHLKQIENDIQFTKEFQRMYDEVLKCIFSKNENKVEIKVTATHISSSGLKNHKLSNYE